MARLAHKIKPAIVYLATNKINGKRYIGITCRSLSVRRCCHFWSAARGSETYFHRAIRKHGKDNFGFSTLMSCATYADACKEEIRLIAELMPEYNQTAGGDGYLGWSPTAEHRAAISERKKGKPGPWAGKQLPQSLLDGRRKWNRSEDGQRSWAECMRRGPIASQRKVICLDDDRIFDAAARAAEYYDIDPSSITAVCKQRRRSAGGRVFRFHQGDVA